MSLVIGNYEGHFPFNRFSVSQNAPQAIGVYYCGVLNTDGRLGTLYVGRALGDGVTIRSRLLDHLNSNEWPDITHFGYCVCFTAEEAESFEKAETIRLGIPKYNKRIG